MGYDYPFENFDQCIYISVLIALLGSHYELWCKDHFSHLWGQSWRMTRSQEIYRKKIDLVLVTDRQPEVKLVLLYRIHRPGNFEKQSAAINLEELKVTWCAVAPTFFCYFCLSW